MIQKIEFRPGIVREKTEYANAGGWFTADKVRFRAGYPEKIGGWQAVSREQFKGTCRSLHQWSSVELRYYAAAQDDLATAGWSSWPHLHLHRAELLEGACAGAWYDQRG
jgi:hypothetical protein